MTGGAMAYYEDEEGPDDQDPGGEGAEPSEGEASFEDVFAEELQRAHDAEPAPEDYKLPEIDYQKMFAELRDRERTKLDMASGGKRLGKYRARMMYQERTKFLDQLEGKMADRIIRQQDRQRAEEQRRKDTIRNQNYRAYDRTLARVADMQRRREAAEAKREAYRHNTTMEEIRRGERQDARADRNQPKPMNPLEQLEYEAYQKDPELLKWHLAGNKDPDNKKPAMTAVDAAKWESELGKQIETQEAKKAAAYEWWNDDEAIAAADAEIKSLGDERQRVRDYLKGLMWGEQPGSTPDDTAGGSKPVTGTPGPAGAPTPTMQNRGPGAPSASAIPQGSGAHERSRPPTDQELRGMSQFMQYVHAILKANPDMDNAAAVQQAKQDMQKRQAAPENTTDPRRRAYVR